MGGQPLDNSRQAPPECPRTLEAVEGWLRAHFGRYFLNTRGEAVPWASYHEEFWSWVIALEPGVRPRPFIAIWPRGGGKSSTAEMAAAFIAKFQLRRYALYISSSQRQADDHVGNVEPMLGTLRLERALNTYGTSKGWRRNRLRTPHFTLDALGLDSAARGAKLDAERVGLLIFDDIDEQDDSPDVTARKIRDLTQKVLPSGTADMAVLGVQNLPNSGGIFAQLASRRADFLTDRKISGPHPALADFDANAHVETWIDDEGNVRYRITGGQPIWEKLDRQACEDELNKIGLRAFRIEMQHESRLLSAKPFPREKWRYFDQWPDLDWFDVLVQSWDATFGTENDQADTSFVAGHLWAKKRDQVFLLARTFARLNFPDSCEAVLLMSAQYPGAYVKLIEDKANGPAIYQSLRSKVFGLSLQPVGGKHGSKLARAHAVSPLLHERRAWLPSPVLAPWVVEFVDYMDAFPAKPNDDGDATSQAWGYLEHPKPVKDTVREAQQKEQERLQQVFQAVRRNGHRVVRSRTGV